MTAILILISLALPAAAEEIAAPALEVSLRPRAEVAGDWVLIGNLAELSGLQEGRLAEIAGMRMAHTPMPGVERVVSRDDVAKKLVQMGVRERVVFKGDVAGTSVVAAVRVIPGEQLVAFAREHLKSRVKWPEEKVRIEEPAPSRSVTVPMGEVEMRASISGRKLAGLVPVAVEVWSEGKRQAKVLLSFRISVMVPVPHLKHAVQPGDMLTESDLETRDRELALLPEDAVLSMSDIAGQKVLRPMTEGSFLKRGDVSAPTVLLKGATVTLLARIGSVEAKTYAKSREDGAAGQVITVVNVSSKRTVKARVVDSETVEAVLP